MNHVMTGFVDELTKLAMSPTAKRILVGSLGGGALGAGYGGIKDGSVESALKKGLIGAGLGGVTGYGYDTVRHLQGVKAKHQATRKAMSARTRQYAKDQRKKSNESIEKFVKRHSKRLRKDLEESNAWFKRRGYRQPHDVDKAVREFESMGMGR